MPHNIRSELINLGKTNYKNMNFIRTDFRVENLKDDLNYNRVIFDEFFKKKKLSQYIHMNMK